MSDDPDHPVFPPVDPAAPADGLGETISAELLASLLADGDDDLAAWGIERALVDAPRVEVYDGLVADAMRLVGQRWESGQWSVAEEHLASQTLVRTLERVRPALGPTGRIGPLAVLAGAPGEQHAIGLVLLEHLLSEQGWTVANLGADVPAADLGRFVARNQAVVVALSASDAGRVPDVAASIQAVRDGSTIRLPVMLGGRLAGGSALPSDLDVDWAGTTLAGAITYAGTLLDERGAGAG